jgi:hypothetical protein
MAKAVVNAREGQKAPFFSTLQQKKDATGQALAGRRVVAWCATAALAVGLLALISGSATAQSIWSAGTQKGQEAKQGLKEWLQIGGSISFIVCGIIWVATGRTNWRWAGGAAGGMFIGFLSDQIANFFGSII